MIKDFDLDKFDQLVKEQKSGEAKQMIDEYLSQPLGEEEMGAIYAAVATVYMRAVTSLEKDYADSLELLVKNLKEVDSLESGVEDQENLVKTRESLL